MRATKCKRCGASKEGASDYCVLCYYRHHKPCPECTIVGGRNGRRVHVHRTWDGKKIHCDHCRDERFVVE